MSDAPKKQAGKLLLPAVGIVSIVAIVLLKAGFIFLLLAMLPTVIAYFIDHDESKPIFKTVLACNLAATLPSLAPMVKAGIQMKEYDVSHLMMNPSVWLLVYSGAAAGWCLIFLCRFIASFFITLLYEYRIAAMERLQRRLVDEWGQIIRQKS